MPWIGMGEGEKVWVDNPGEYDPARGLPSQTGWAQNPKWEPLESRVSTGGQDTPRPNVQTVRSYKEWAKKPAEFIRTPEQLGWTSEEAKRFRDAGVEKLPDYMNKAAIYGPGKSLASDDPIQTFIDTYTGPVTDSGKSTDALAIVGEDDGDPMWKQAYTQARLARKWAPNEGAWEASIKPAMMGISGILAPIAGLGALGGFAGVGAGMAAGEAGAAGTGAGLSSSPSMFGQALEGGGMFGGSQTLSNPAGLGGLFGTGVGNTTSGLSALGGAAPNVFAGGLGQTGFSESMPVGGNVGGYSNTATMATDTAAASGSPWSVPPTDVSGSLTSTPSMFGQNLEAGGLFGTGATTSALEGSGGLFGTGVGVGDLAGVTGTASGLGGGGSWLDTLLSGGKSAGGLLSSLLGGGSGTSGEYDWLKPLLGVGGAVAGGVMGNNALQDAIDKAQKYYEPFYNLGVSNIPAFQASDPTGGAKRFTDELEALGKNFKFDTTDPAYTYKMDEMTKAANANLAARGMYNTSAGLNLLDKGGRGIMADEYDKQYQRKYGNLTDLYTMASKTGATDYNKLLDAIKIGTGASGSAGNAQLASGQSSANLWSGLGAMPLNYMLLQSMLGKTK